MPDILHDLAVRAPIEQVFDAVSRPEGLDHWWTLAASGSPDLGAELVLGFGPGYDWRARVARCEPPTSFELEITRADADWTGTRVGFELEAGEATTLRFHHRGWREANPHFRASSFCWALYLRHLKRYLENDERVPYSRRYDV